MNDQLITVVRLLTELERNLADQEYEWLLGPIAHLSLIAMILIGWAIIGVR